MFTFVVNLVIISFICWCTLMNREFAYYEHKQQGWIKWFFSSGARFSKWKLLFISKLHQCDDFLNFPCHFLGAVLPAHTLYPCLISGNMNTNVKSLFKTSHAVRILNRLFTFVFLFLFMWIRKIPNIISQLLKLRPDHEKKKKKTAPRENYPVPEPFPGSRTGPFPELRKIRPMTLFFLIALSCPVIPDGLGRFAHL